MPALVNSYRHDCTFSGNGRDYPPECGEWPQSPSDGRDPLAAPGQIQLHRCLLREIDRFLLGHLIIAERSKLSDGLGGAGGAHGALTNSRDARTDGAEAVRCSAWL